MKILVSVGRLLVGLAACLVVLAGILGGGAAAGQAGQSFLFGALAGGAAGLVIAGCLFGALAAIFQIADNTAKTARLLERLEARAPK